VSIYDFAVIGFYLIFMLLLGPVYKSFSKTASDFFRGGGGMLWWVVGSSTFMTTFTAWSFTGGAQRAYETGTFFLLLFCCNLVALTITYFFTAARFRQMRIITWVEGIQKRYGNVNEQFFAWMPIPFNIIVGGFYIFVISKFMQSVFGVEIVMLIVGLGIVVTVMTLLGGSWAATAGDFVQMMVVIAITMLMTFLTFQHEVIGGVTGMFEKLPAHHFDWTMFDRTWIIIFFAITLAINQSVQMNSMTQGAAKYVFAKDGRDARKATLLAMAGFLVLSPIWIIPAMAATILHPDLAAEFPNLKEGTANTAAYVAMAMSLLPKGLVGLLVCAIFAASVTSLNSLMNIASGTFVRNIYIRIVNRNASESRQILVGRIFLLFYGGLWILAAWGIRTLESAEFSLFDMMLQGAVLLQVPMMVPQFLGIFIRRTPSWSAWSTMLVGFATSISWKVMLGIVGRAKFYGWLFAGAGQFSSQELTDLDTACTTALLMSVCVGWYLLSVLFYRGEDQPYVEQVDRFFDEMHTPIDRAVEHGPEYDNDSRQYGVLGKLCLVYGSVILLLLLIPNPWGSRLGILFCGGIIAGVGLLLVRISNRLRQRGLLVADGEES
jgi:Na+/proline symporter